MLFRSLERLHLKSTGLREVPDGLFGLEKLAFADLTFNDIVEMPDELFDVPDTRPVNYNFTDNPLSAASQQRVAEYKNNFSIDKQILIQVDDELVDELHDLGIETESDESGLETGGESSVDDD